MNTAAREDTHGCRLHPRPDRRVGTFEDITLGPHEEAQWWFHWDFDDRHWQRMSFVLVGRGVMTIVAAWVEHEVSHEKWGTHDTIVPWVRLRNNSGAVSTVRPTVFVAPTRYCLSGANSGARPRYQGTSA